MSYRYALGWIKNNPVMYALSQLCPWKRLTCRVDGIWPGIKTPIPTGTPGGDLHQICINEAKNLWNRYTDIGVLWSGGMDSSLVMVSLESTRPSGSKLTVIAQEPTLTEQHDILDWLLENGASTEVLNAADLRARVDRGGMVVSGIHADTLLCGDIIRYNDLYQDIWDMSVRDMFIRITGLPESAIDQHLAAIEPVLAAMPVERTAANVAWWLDYVCAWETDKMCLKFMFDLKPHGEGYINFFGSDAFQLWSMQDVSVKVGHTKVTHKQLYKQIVINIIGKEPKIPINTEPGDDFGVSMDMNQIIAIREDWSVIKQTVN